LSIVVKPNPLVSSARISLNGLVFSGNSGVGYANYYLLGSTNLFAPVANWTRLLPNQFDAGGNFILTNAFDPKSPQKFYRLQLQ
jgi:hypothetical protein